ncbi:MAG TPA: alpha/beta fold hydrolase [Kofleriaceae bacterium]|nr:alpha/beta fold hydrolase [Kofleriaceae bacterium]
MSKHARNHLDDLRGASRLAVDATRGVTDIVERMHRTLGWGTALLGRPVYASIHGITRLVGAGIERLLAELAPLVDSSVTGSQRDALLAVVNGVLGDYLVASENPLAIEMHLRHAGAPLDVAALADPRAKIAVLVHGSCMTEGQWLRAGHDHGAALALDLGYTPLYVRYNSGLHISTNGRTLAALLDSLVATWPVAIDELVLIGHSMGGLVAHSACHIGGAWREQVRALIMLGSPHHGAVLERGGNWIDRTLELTPYSAPLAALGRIRSAGVTDLRHGNLLDSDWEGHDRFAHGHDMRAHHALPAGLACYAVAATLSPEPGPRLRGDGLVSVDSALGKHEVAARCLAFTDERRAIVYGTGHIDLLGAPAVYEALRRWLS